VVIGCIRCGKQIQIRDMTGLSYIPPVCSESCFVDYIKTFTSNTDNVYEYFSKGIKPFRSKWEELVFYKLKELFGNVLYEPFILERMYVPDFYLPDHNVFLEVKGRWTSYTKFATMAQKYPIILLNRDVLKQLKWIH